jgi:GTP1/Obg family GTP-binding protein
MSSSTRRLQQRDNEYGRDMQRQHESTIRSIEMIKDNIRRSFEEVRREMPRYFQTVTGFQNETADALVEIADNFLELQKGYQFNAISLGSYGRK